MEHSISYRQEQMAPVDHAAATHPSTHTHKNNTLGMKQKTTVYGP